MLCRSRGVVTHFLPKDDCKKQMRDEITQARPPLVQPLNGGASNSTQHRQLKANGLTMGDQIGALQRRIATLDASGHTQVPVVQFRNGQGEFGVA